jgi:hypothetical protein
MSALDHERSSAQQRPLRKSSLEREVRRTGNVTAQGGRNYDGGFVLAAVPTSASMYAQAAYHVGPGTNPVYRLF